MTFHPIRERKVNINFFNFTTVDENLLLNQPIIPVGHTLDLLQLLDASIASEPFPITHDPTGRQRPDPAQRDQRGRIRRIQFERDRLLRTKRRSTHPGIAGADIRPDPDIGLQPPVHLVGNGIAAREVLGPAKNGARLPVMQYARRLTRREAQTDQFVLADRIGIERE